MWLWSINFVLIAVVPHALTPTVGLQAAPLTVWSVNMLPFDDDCSSPRSFDFSPSSVDYPVSSVWFTSVWLCACSVSPFPFLSSWSVFSLARSVRRCLRTSSTCFSTSFFLLVIHNSLTGSGFTSLFPCWFPFLFMSLPYLTLPELSFSRSNMLAYQTANR